MRRAAQRCQTETPRTRRAHRVAAQQRSTEVLESFAKAPKEGFAAGAKLVSQQHADRFGTFGRKVGDVRGDQFPGDIGWVLIAKKMNSLDHRVMGEDKRLAAEVEHRRIVSQSSRAGGTGELAQASDEAFLGRHGTAMPRPPRSV
jgi:hypothetical protein